MKITDIFSITIAFISLVISILTAYFAYFKPSKVKMLKGTEAGITELAKEGAKRVIPLALTMLI